MKEKQTQMWIPLYVDKWIFGSTRIELEPAERGVFVDLMAFGAKDEGYIRANETTPYHHRQLSGLLNIPIELLDSTITKCLHFSKLEETSPGIYKLCNWEKFQLSDDYKYRIETGRKPIPGTQVRQNSDCSPKNVGPIREDKIVEDKRRKGEEAQTPPTILQVRALAEAEGLKADPDKFFHWQESKAWAGIIDWQAAFRYWCKTEYKDKPEAPKTQPSATVRAWQPPESYKVVEAEQCFHNSAIKDGKCIYCKGAEIPVMGCNCEKYGMELGRYKLKVIGGR